MFSLTIVLAQGLLTMLEDLFFLGELNNRWSYSLLYMDRATPALRPLRTAPPAGMRNGIPTLRGRREEEETAVDLHARVVRSCQRYT
ncbi:hypothetical protein Taro_002238 [Colocasia esculenta]|uniref:Uncharacterized protein n=1 Tax=Colocasia esculenta TaxID=4460 RepID=A0A843TN22_COLES|nr:hypothetical protein [Colocasia esculenta]